MDLKQHFFNMRRTIHRGHQLSILGVIIFILGSALVKFFLDLGLNEWAILITLFISFMISVPLLTSGLVLTRRATRMPKIEQKSQRDSSS